MEGPAGGRPCISAPAVLPVRRKLRDQVQNLRVQDGRSLEVLSRRRRAREHKYPRADDGADAERGERPRTQRLLETMPGLVGFRDQLVDGLAAEQLVVRGAGRWWLCQRGWSPRSFWHQHIGTWHLAGDRTAHRMPSAECQVLPSSASPCRVPASSLCAWPNRERIRGASADFPSCASCATARLALLAFFLAQFACVCHECCLFLLKKSLACLAASY